MKSFIRAVIIAKSLCIAAINYKQSMPEHELDLLKPRSFFENYIATGTAIMLSSTLKLLPKTESKLGG